MSDKLELEEHVPFLDEVEKELQDIEHKYALSKGYVNNRINEQDMDVNQCLNKLSREFDTLGLITLDLSDCSSSKILQQLIRNSYALIATHRRTLRQLNDANINKTHLNLHNLNTDRKLDSYEHEIKKKNEEIKCANLRINTLLGECKETNNKNKELQCQILLLKKYCASRERQHQHKVHQLEIENATLKEKCGESIGKYASTDSIILSHLKKYKDSEELYKETITKLERNNTKLLGQILKLKEEVLWALFNQNTKCSKCTSAT